MQEKKIIPDDFFIREHISYVLKHTQHQDARFEVGGLVHTNTKNFTFDEIDKAVAHAVSVNNSGHNTYLIYSGLNPDVMPAGRSNDNDFYTTNFVWCDIDEKHDAEKLKQTYSICPPHLAIITARVPHRRVQLVWRLSEPCDDPETLKEANIGLAQHLDGDPKVFNPCRLMRIAGTVNLPNEKKKAEGRIAEVTEFNILHNNNYIIENILSAFPVKDYAADVFSESITPIKTDFSSGSLKLEEVVNDGRDAYMSEMVFAATINLTAEYARWPTAQEVFDNVWPVYSRKVTLRNGRTLEQDGRGTKALKQKISSKLRAFSSGSMKRYGFGSVEEIVSKKPPKQDFNPETGELNKEKPSTLYYIPARNIKLNLDDKTLIKDILGQQELSVIYGESNCGKTFFMTDLALHISRGVNWRDKRVSKGGVMYAALEGARGMSGRFMAYCTKHAIASPDFPFAIMPCGLDFYTDKSNIAEFIDMIKKSQDDIGDPALIVIDTLARALAGGDENSGQDMGKLVHLADIIRSQTSAHLSFVHHSGKNKALGARGHSSLRAAVDTEIEISRDEDADYSTIRVVKQREIEIVEPMYFSLEKVVIGRNGFAEDITSCVVNVYEKDETEPNKAPLNAQEKFVLEAITNAINKHGFMKRPYKDGPELKCITFAILSDMLEEMGYGKMYNKDGESTSLQATKTIRVKLRDKNIIGFNGALVWMLSY